MSTGLGILICLCGVLHVIPGGHSQSSDVQIDNMATRDGIHSLSGNSADAVLKMGLKQALNRFAMQQQALNQGNSEDRFRLPQVRAPLKQCGVPGAGDLDSFRVASNRVRALLNGTRLRALPEEIGAKMAAIDQADSGAPMRLVVDHLNTRTKREDVIVPRKTRSLSVQVGAKSAKFVQETIVGGFDAVPNEICWQVKITIQLSGGLATCGGSLVGTRTVITAAHCTLNPFVEGRKEQISADSYTVQIGAMTRSFNQFNPSADRTGCAQNVKVSRVVTHPDYSQDVGDNDIGMLILDTPVDIDGKQCACLLCLRNEVPAVNELCVVSGYGDESEGGSANRFPVPLKFVRVQVLEQSMDGTCAVSTDSRGRSTDLDKFICAGNVVGEDSCQGDSGGPLFCFDQNSQSYYLAGLVSFGDGCGTGVGGQYTKIQRFIPWITANSFPDTVLG